MKHTICIALLLCLTLGFVTGQSPIHLRKIGSYSTNIYNAGGAEISAYDKNTKRLFVVNGGTGKIDIVDISSPQTPFLLSSIDLSPWGIGANSVDISQGILVAAVENFNKQANGSAVFFDMQGQYLKHVIVGALPDMIKFSPDGKHIVVANEGEPNATYTNDPPGTISIIDFPNIHAVKQSKVWTLDFSAYNTQLPAGIKVNGPGSSVAQDLEPEFVAISKDSRTAYVTLQENNAIAEIDIKHKTILSVYPLGYKNHNLAGKGLDASDQNSGVVNIANWPVYGMYQPDAIEAFEVNQQEFLIMANEGDAREYTAFTEAKRVSTLLLDATVFPNAATLKTSSAIGRLNVTSSLGDIDQDGDYDALYAFGSRSFTIRDLQGNLIWDSGDFLEQLTYNTYPENFNCSNTNNTRKNRSDDKGPEPESITTAKILDSVYAFVGLERIGGVVVFNITDVYNPYFVEYVNSRNFQQVPDLNFGGDLGPEGLLFIPRSESPNGNNLLIVSNEISGTIAIFETDYLCGDNEVKICNNGVSSCINSGSMQSYLSNGASLGSCSGNLRYAKENLIDSFSTQINYDRAASQISIQFDDATDLEYQINIYDINGRKVLDRKLNIGEGNTSFNIELDVLQGIYLVNISGGLTNHSQKLFIN